MRSNGESGVINKQKNVPRQGEPAAGYGLRGGASWNQGRNRKTVNLVPKSSVREHKR